MKLQVALDYFRVEDALALMRKIHEYVDIAEIGTPLGLSDGFEAISVIKAAYPNVEVLADIKLMDGGKPISAHAFDAGADIVTILGVTNDSTIRGAVEAARERGKKVCVDTIGTTNLGNRTKELEALGVDCIAVHTAHDMLNCIGAPIEALKVIKANITGDCKAAISGGITPDKMEEIIKEQPDVVIVGSAITKADDPAAVARAIKSYMK